MTRIPPVEMIIIQTRNGAIGKDGQLIYDDPFLQEHIQALTENCTLIMGRKSWVAHNRMPSIYRDYVVLSRGKRHTRPGVVYVPTRLMALLQAQIAEKGRDPDSRCTPHIFVIGGASTFHSFLPFADYLYVIRVDKYVKGDTYFRIPREQFKAGRPLARFRGIDGSMITIKRHTRIPEE